MFASTNGTTDGGVIIDFERTALALIHLIRQCPGASDCATFLEKGVDDDLPNLPGDKLSVQTLMKLGTTLPALRTFDCYALTATEADADALLEARADGLCLFPSLQSFLYWPNKHVPPSVALGLLAHMPSLRVLEVDQEHAADQESTLDRRRRIDLSHLHLRSYRCSELYFGFELPIIHSSNSLESLFLDLGETPKEEPLMLSPFLQLLRARPFNHLRRLILRSGLFCTVDMTMWCDLIHLCPSVRDLHVRCGIDDLPQLLTAVPRPLSTLTIAGNQTYGPQHGDGFFRGLLQMMKSHPTLRTLQKLHLRRCSSDYGILPVNPQDVSPELFSEFAWECTTRRITL
ncbi:hypothetical protein EXIGLDRAFT_737234, partial [Exidia glandulosa HHB12029]